MNDFPFTPLQEAVLEAVSARRLTVVRAGPGSGKTRVFVEALRRQLKGWTSHRTGVAALSFTNVAREVVSQRLGGAPPSPHFLGTLDAFLLRFVVLPFAKLAGAHPNGIRLIPEAVARAIERPEVSYGTSAWEKATIFRYAFSGGDESSPKLSLRDQHGKPIALNDEALASVLAAKQRDWQKYGRVTHSDSQYLASSILRGKHGRDVIALVTRRFPVILVDEFQDTGWFLGRAMVELLRCVPKGLVVGDPDQAIYQFAGANRTLFADVEKDSGASALLLNESHRCAKRVSAAASALSRSQKVVLPRDDAPEGDTFLIVYNGKSFTPTEVVEALGSRVSTAQLNDAAVLLRRAARPLQQLEGPWTGGEQARICQAFSLLRAGEGRQASQVLARQMARLLLGDDNPTIATFKAAGIAPVEWKRATARLLCDAEGEVPNETWNEWLVRVKGLIEQMGAKFGITAQGLGNRLKRTKTGGDKERRVIQDVAASESAYTTLTIHAAKGREFEAVFVLVAKPHESHAPCPSSTWWSDDAGSEEREVAYVACSRAKTMLCVVVHQETYDALATLQPGFVNLFEVIELPKVLEAASKRRRGSAAKVAK